MLKAEFRERNECITCQSKDLTTLSKGKFVDEPLHGFILTDPWGTSPLPFIDEESWHFVQCSNCGQKFHKRILTDEWLQTYYSEWISAAAIEDFLERSAQSNTKFEKAKRWVEHVLQIEKHTRVLQKERPVRILDFGCGDGDFLSHCAQFGFDCHGIDFSSSRYERSNIDFYPSVDVLFDDQTMNVKFDVVTMFEVLEHLAEPLETLSMLTKLLNTGGLFILETPDCKTVTTISNVSDYRHIHPLGHINGFTAESMKKIADNAGLEFCHPGTSQVSADYPRVLKREARRVLSRLVPQSTQMYFRKR